MADHYAKALEYLDDVEVARADLSDEYADPQLRRASVIASLHQRIGASMKLAHVHAVLALAAAAQDMRTAIEARS